MTAGTANPSLSTRTVIAYGAAAGPFEMLKAPALAILSLIHI